MTRLCFLATSLLFAACATDPVEDPTDPVDGVPPAATGDGVDGVSPPPVHFAVRNVRVSCGQDFDGNDLVSVSATSDLAVRLSLATFHRGPDSDDLELDRHFPEPISLGGITTFSQTSLLNSGRFTPGITSPITCATISDFAIKAIVLFQDGRVGCALGGNATEAAKLRCED